MADLSGYEQSPAPVSSIGTDPSKDAGAAKAVIKNVDMSEEMQQESVDIAIAALEKYSIEKDIASFVKREFDRKHGPTWHAVVGKNFGSFVTHGTSRWDTFVCLLLRVSIPCLVYSETKHFIYFYIGPLAFLIWKS